ncbi:hypothetical protein [Streptomyces sp. NBC_00878]|uniref:hypothetical protein n=1 Tax=Streptomyces sp. NBC_00878 TaxID=2975854 RepID=UPI002257A36C|nr:hypothetical protein [Streptomyces sp. NBC_00878]MCX4905299.1 hypothetical protein [Streptomyces sp. NBC_00878]
MPAGKAIAIASMPTAILMGMGFTPTLARAEDKPSAKNLTIDEYKDCVDALEDETEESKDDASPTPSPSASTSASADAEKEEQSASKPSGSDTSGSDSSSDSGSDDKPEPTPSASESETPAENTEPTPTPSPSESETTNPLDPLGIGEAIKDIFTPDEEETATPTPTPSASTSQTEKPADTSGSTAKDTVEDTADKAEDTVKDVTDAASGAAEDTADKAEEAADDATASPSPSPSESSTTDPDDCPTATDDEGGLEQGIPTLADDPWQLEASSLLLKGADYQGIVKVKTANGTVKEVLKYVISDGSDIGDLHQIVDDKQAGKTYHVQAGKGTTSTIRDGKTVMYTESISGNLLGLIPITFDPKHPPPLNIPLIYFTNVKVVQAAQFGGTLTIPGMHQYSTD